MSDSPILKAFDTTPRQKRLRTLTTIIIVVIVAMIVFALNHPFFRPKPPAEMTESVRKAIAVQGMFILGYMAIVFALAISLLVIAWLYVREIRLQLLIAKRDIWQQIAERHLEAQELKKEKQKHNGGSE